jgi:putative SOS response-associated peptidase YedK
MRYASGKCQSPIWWEQTKNMCGRFTLRASPAEIAGYFEFLRDLTDWDKPRFNIAPTQSILAVRKGDSGRVPARLRWGLIPSWAKDMKMAASMINARAETVAEKPAYRAAFKRRRCLIPANGFYEWQKDGKLKIPYLISLRSSELFAFAGLWEKWHAPDGNIIESCTVLTTSANELMATIHDRMPVILPPSVYDVWLSPEVEDTEALTELLAQYPADDMQAVRVSDVVNNARNEVDPRLA